MTRDRSRSRTQILIAVSVILLTFLLNACRAKNSAAQPFTADIAVSSTVVPEISGKLYVSGNRMRLDWGTMADVFDLKTRQGWRTFRGMNVYMVLESRNLSTFAPEMEGGSICPHATYPSSCKLVGSEVVEGRAARKWDLYDPVQGFHVYFWTDEAQGVTLRMAIGDAATYKVSNVQIRAVPDSMFEFPAGSRKVDEQFRPIEND